MTYTCQRCGYTWKTRPGRIEMNRPKPVACPKCNSREWDEPK